MNKFNLQIITPRGYFYNDESTLLTLKISEGYIGIMANRMPLMSSVKVSSFSIKNDNNSKEHKGIIGNGIIKTSKDNVLIIVNDVIWVDDITKHEIEKNISEIEKRLNQEKSEGIRKEKIKQQLKFWNLLSKEHN